jgi:hypothetical protein
METIYPCCAGLDIHKRTVVACVRRVEPTGRVRDWVQTFGTMTGELLALGYTRKPETAQHPSKSIRVPERARERPRRGLTGMSLI